MSWSDRASLEDVQRGLGLAQAHGWWRPESTRLLFHDLGRMEMRLGLLRAAFPPGTLHAVAIKANPVIEVLRAVVETGCGLEAASWEEVRCALAAGCPPERLVFDSPAKTRSELTEALRLGLWLNADNSTELERIQALGAGDHGRVGLRVNPALGVGRIASTSTVGASSKFGVLLEQVPELLERFPFIRGLHVHTGSQGCGLELLSAAAHATARVAMAHGLDWVDLGGGLPVRYTDSDPEPPQVGEWAAALQSMEGWDSLRLLTELGRSVHGGCGWAISRIETVKQVNGRVLYVTHLGADLLLRRVYRAREWDHEFWILDPDGVPRQGAVQADIGGPLCFAGDLIARDRTLPQAQPGDLLVIRDTGAYTLSMWSRHCSRGLPGVLGLRGEQAVGLLAPESAQDVVEFWSRGAR